MSELKSMCLFQACTQPLALGRAYCDAHARAVSAPILAKHSPTPVLPSDSTERKSYPVISGFVDYFPDALQAAAESGSFVRAGKPSDETDYLISTLIERTGVEDLACAWVSCLALLEIALGGNPQTRELDSTAAVLDLFPRAVAAVSRLSWFGNQKHNPGKPLHWSRDKSNDHPDTFGRHWLTRHEIDPSSGMIHMVSCAWRLGAWLQVEVERERGLPISRGSR